MELTYRNFCEADIDTLVHFWNGNADWDVITRETWEHRFLKSPYGAPVIILALNENSIAGQFPFLPVGVCVDEKEVLSYRPFAIIINKNIRGALKLLAMFQIVFKMFNHAIDLLKDSSVPLIHMLPDPRETRFFKAFSKFQIGYFPLWSLPLPLQRTFDLPACYETIFIHPLDERINTLWNENRKLNCCCVVRNAKTLEWKTSSDNYKLLGLLKNRTLAGLCVFIPKPDDKQWLICDILANDTYENLSVLIKATCQYAQYDPATTKPEKPLQKIAILATPALQTVLEPLGFQKDNYLFPVVVQLLDDSLTKAQVAPERWYVSAND